VAAENKTERATPRRRQKSRERGQVARSPELPTALAVLAVTLFIYWEAPAWDSQWRQLFAESVSGAARTDITADGFVLHRLGMTVLGLTGPVLLLGWVVAVLSMVAQGGFVFAPAALAPRWERLNPAAQLSRMVSLEGWSRILKSIVPVSGLIYLSGSVLFRDWNEMVQPSSLGARGVILAILRKAFEISWKSGLWLLVYSGGDYLLRRLHWEQELRMSRQEVRDEMKELEGQPAIRLRIRRLQREMRRRRLIRDVSRATVVVTNPNEYAVALRYEAAVMTAPMVVAKGRHRLAQQIKRLARWNNVPIVEHPPLAQALYRAVEVGQTIPAKLYTAVAEILAFLYRTQGRLRSDAKPSSNAGRPANR